jgi:hypothetical protein
MSNSSHDEREFEAYLQRRSMLHRRLGDQEQLEPPADLDEYVLRAASQAIRTPSPIRVYRAPRWALPVGLAATILLSCAILLNLNLHTDKRTESAPQRSVPLANSPARTLASPAGAAGAKRQSLPSVTSPEEERAAASKASKEAAQPLEPREWLQRIAALRARGETDQADNELRRFRRAFPQYPVTPAAAAPAPQTK